MSAGRTGAGARPHGEPEQQEGKRRRPQNPRPDGHSLPPVDARPCLSAPWLLPLPAGKRKRARGARIVLLVTGRPTIKDVAERAGVSIATVSRALNDKGDVSAPTRERVREVARSVGYTPDPVARSLVGQKTRLVAVVVGDNAGHRDLSLIFFGKVLAAISRGLSQSGYDPLLLQPSDVGPEHRFDAAILIGVDGDDPLVAEVAGRDVPLVGVDVRFATGRAAYVGSDHAEGVRLALAHLHALGHRRIAHLAGATNTSAGLERLEAFRRETAALGLEVPEE